ncbi:MAG: DNA replication/repair protein RecF [Rickettsiales bacterium]
MSVTLENSILAVNRDDSSEVVFYTAKSTCNPKKISLSSLSLSNFRNYRNTRIEVSEEPVVLTGVNGAGKTNILEAISLLIAGRGLRKAKLSDIDSLNITLPEEAILPVVGRDYNTGWTVSANIYGKQGEVKIGTGRSFDNSENADKRIVKIDGQLTSKHSELLSHISIIWLTPQMEQLFLEGASSGRKFLDRLVFNFDPAHATCVNEYEYAMRERNKLLQFSGADNNWLSSLEKKMAASGVAIAQARISTCEHINYAIGSSTLSFPKAYIDIIGYVEELLKDGKTALEAENMFAETLAISRRKDGESGRTNVGTHRSELLVTHVKKNMPASACSTGEQKAMMLSIILAQARSGAIWHRVVPIILLDEIASHLDSAKRQELFEEIYDIGAQTWMTGTDQSLFMSLHGKAQFFKVDNGSVII